MALKQAGWSNIKIGEEMGIKPSSVAVLVCQHKKKMESSIRNEREDRGEREEI